MKDDSFVVESFMKNVLENYGNHKWIKKEVFFLPLTLQSDEWAESEKLSHEEIFKVEFETVGNIRGGIINTQFDESS